jgi:membrane protease YdiL (CAAX protease family)
LPYSDDSQFDSQSSAPLGADPVPSPANSLPAQPGTPAASGRLPIPPPVENPVWTGWDVVLIVGLSVVTIFAFQFIILIGAHRFFYPHASLVELTQRPMLLLISQFLIDAAVLGYMLLLVEGKYHVRFANAIRWNWPKSEWKLLALGAVMLLVLNVLESVLPMPKNTPFDKLFERPRDAYLLAVIAVSVGPLVEELFFRGLFYPVVARRWGVAWGIFLTALPFALMHMPQYGYAWGALLVIFIVGAVCGMVRAFTHSVAASFLVHVGYNGSQMLIAVLWTRGFTHMPKALVTLGHLTQAVL